MRQRHGIVLLFGVGIVLPSLILGFLAFRGVQNDRALLEKERLMDTRRAAERVSRAVDEAIAEAENTLAGAVSKGDGRPLAEHATTLRRPAVDHPLIEQLFYLQERGNIGFPHEGGLYLADGRRAADASPPVAGHGASADFQAGERLEFQRADYPGALAAYRRAVRSGTGPVSKGQALNAVARTQRKSGLLREAVATYEEILRECGQEIIPGGMPLGPSAGLEICALTGELGDISRSIRTSLGIYRSLLGREWTLERAEFDLFAERLKAHLRAHLSSRPTGLDLAPWKNEFRILEGQEAGQRKRTERRLIFERDAAPVITAKVRDAPGGPAGSFHRLAFELGHEAFFISIMGPPTPPAGPGQSLWGLILDAEQLKDGTLRRALREQFPSTETAWVIKGKGGAAVIASENPPAGPATVRTDFAGGVPDWALEIHQPPPRLLKTFFFSLRGVYSLVFLLIAGILVFGLALTIRAVSHELELARLKSDFVSTVSHEFKSPLTSIRQLAEMLQSGRVPSAERRQRYYDVLLEQSERLSLLTDNILSLAKIEEGRAKFKFEATDVLTLLSDVVSSIQERVRHEGFDIALRGTPPIPPLALDRAALSQAVTNLIDNAVKYSGDSKKIIVTAAAEGQSLSVAVRDFGIGIKNEDIPRVFERFFRGGDELTRSVKGSGLGLTLVKEIVRAHGGKVRVESEPGKGSVFTILLPLARVGEV